MTHNPPRIGFVSLGCPKALVDSERILTQLRAEGYALSDSYEGAELVIINTCGFIDSAVQESLDTIGEALDENGRVIVTGCLGGRDEGELVRQTHPNVLAVTGPQAYQEVMDAVHQHLPPRFDPFVDVMPEPGSQARGKTSAPVSDEALDTDTVSLEDAVGVKLTPRHYAYLKISEGCNHRCSFCIIPSLRGDLVSRPIGEVMTEAENLVNVGVRELLVVSQDTSAYGIDTRYRLDFWGGRPLKTRFRELAAALGSLDAWIRLHYVYPYPHVDDAVELMAEGLILPYLDIPFQHASHRILKLMKRPASSENVLKRIAKWREICPEITIRSTFIVGFPGETEAEFQELLDFLDEAQLDRVGAFAYSPVDGATANDLPDPVPEDVKQERLARFMEKQAAISAAKLAKKVGQRMPVLVDAVDDSGAVARSMADAPEIDGVVYLPEVTDVAPGDFLEVEIIEADEHDLWGVPVP
ncbi:30S ribosomal protein S12 methylthiotransferase RimO [Guyparkeria sp. SCN-R1]|uniref:30S ribosomal protein S12 methylthiotransferase RimO n=1 Tax=Guyparkeria sp. SCN-R1 TaxID=2341113 RepID=UPI000F64C1A1|nr:30S ribosomal protein S12 methylthiotransferase RimO [Guyparkeria sp. SCN-R1]RRQ20387.1 30S ribosomal protein S12 methylthiotransferase RimO [Guyparkeria sp. SCN-R1]